MSDPVAVVKRWLAAFEAMDVDGITEPLADDVVLETELMPRPITGPQVLHEILVGATDAYESVHLKPKRMVAAGNEVAVLLDMRIRFKSDIEMLGETIPTAGRELSAVGAMFVEVNEAGEITRIARVRDTLTLVQQLGVRPDQVSRLIEKVEQELRKRAA